MTGGGYDYAMRYLLLPENSSLSHLARCLALRDELVDCGHEVFIAASGRGSSFLQSLGIRHFALPDIQDGDGSSAPRFTWFRPVRFMECVDAEARLMRRLRPDRVLGVFHFTGPASARLAGVPYDSLICGCMTPLCREVLGFGDGDEGREEQAAYLLTFRTACAASVSGALAKMGLPRIDDAWQMLLGERTFLWDFPEFLPIETAAGMRHIGPVSWERWPRESFDIDRVANLKPPVALVSFGAGGVAADTLASLIKALLALDWSVVLAAGGDKSALSAFPSNGRLASFEFLPIAKALRMVKLVLCHGGQGIIFEALRQEVPVIVVPLQPEQAHNGLCLERLGWGARLFPPRPYRGVPTHTEDLKGLCRETTSRAIERLLADPALEERLKAASSAIRGYRGARALAESLAVCP